MILQGIDTINSVEGLEEDGYLSDEDTSLSNELADAQRQWEESLPTVEQAAQLGTAAPAGQVYR